MSTRVTLVLSNQLNTSLRNKSPHLDDSELADIVSKSLWGSTESRNTGLTLQETL